MLQRNKKGQFIKYRPRDKKTGRFVRTKPTQEEIEKFWEEK